MGLTPIPRVPPPRPAPTATSVEAARLAYVREHYAAGRCSIEDVARMAEQCLRGVQPTAANGRPMFPNPALRNPGKPVTC